MKTNRTPQFTLLLLASCLLASPLSAQVSSLNIVGYYNRVLYPGDNLIANQISATNNDLNTLFTAGAPDGTTFTKWNPAGNSFLPYSVFDAGSGTWSIDYSLDPVAG